MEDFEIEDEEALVFRVDTLPVAQPRSRHRIAKTKTGKEYVQVYTPTNAPINLYRTAVQQEFSRVCASPRFEQGVQLGVEFVLPRPQSMMWKRKATPSVPHVIRPDMSNLIKGTEDALNGLAWRDDAQIWRLQATKRIAAGDERPHVVITLIEGGDLDAL